MNREVRKAQKSVSKWPWGVIVANLLTFLTLWLSIYQNNKNESENNVELKRIRFRDSTQSVRDSIRTKILTNQLYDQIKENRRNRNKDSTQLSLFTSQISLLNKSLRSQNEGIKIQNKGISIQNQALETERLDKQSQLVLKVGFKGENYREGQISPNLSYSLTNVGNSIAQDIISNYCIVSIDNTNNQLVSCINNFETAYDNVSIKPGESEVIKPIIIKSFPIIKKGNYRNVRDKKYQDLIQKHFLEIGKIDPVKQPKEYSETFKKNTLEESAFRKKYPDEDFTNFMIIKISYTDKYREVPNEVYAILSVNFYMISENNGRIEALKTRYSSLPKLLECIRENKFNEKQITEQLKRSTSKNEISTSI